MLNPLDTMVHRTRALDNSILLSDARGQLLVSYITEHVTWEWQITWLAQRQCMNTTTVLSSTDYCTLQTTVLQSTRVYCTLHNTLLFPDLHYCTALQNTVLYCPLFCNLLCITALQYALLHSNIHHCTLLYSTVLNCAFLLSTLHSCTLLYITEL